MLNVESLGLVCILCWSALHDVTIDIHILCTLHRDISTISQADWPDFHKHVLCCQDVINTTIISNRIKIMCKLQFTTSVFPSSAFYWNWGCWRCDITKPDVKCPVAKMCIMNFSVSVQSKAYQIIILLLTLVSDNTVFKKQFGN